MSAETIPKGFIVPAHYIEIDATNLPPIRERAVVNFHYNAEGGRVYFMRRNFIDFGGEQRQYFVHIHVTAHELKDRTGVANKLRMYRRGMSDALKLYRAAK